MDSIEFSLLTIFEEKLQEEKAERRRQNEQERKKERKKETEYTINVKKQQKTKINP